MPDPGTTFGRYVILQRLGSGGMGVVYKAYDPQLDRHVALKVVRVDRGADPAGDDDVTHSVEPRERLLREAQAMAKLSHPNVIAVFDVGTLGDDVFVAMELVDGPSLRAWLAERPRPWREVLAVFLQAGRGLAAAHRANLVHRDFKPDNVLVGADSRVRVADFGLARALDDGAVPAGAPVNLDRSPWLGSLTATGNVVGTPAFMAPEQHLGEAADARADQFSFCVALYEALARVRPFAGDTCAELVTEMERGRIRDPATPMPRFVTHALRRGLRARPADRFPSMDALLGALHRDRRGLGRGLLAVAAAAAAAVAVVVTSRASETRCRGAERHLAGVWDGERREQVRRAFADSGSPLAEQAWRGVSAALDGYAGAFVTAHTAACEATHVRGEQSSELLDLRMDCLNSRLDELSALVDLFARIDRAGVERAVPAARGLHGLAECADVRQLTDLVPPPADPAARARLAELRRRVAEVHALKIAGRFKEGLELARPLPAAAEALGYRPMQAWALFSLGDLTSRAGDARAAVVLLADAGRAGVAGRDLRAAVMAYTNLGVVYGLELQQTEPAVDALKTANALLEALGGDLPLEAKLRGAMGQVDVVRDKHEEALRNLTRARELLVKAYGPDDLDIANVDNDLGGCYRVLRRIPEAFAAYSRALAMREKTLGPDHPWVASTLHNIGNGHYTQGEHAEAQRYYDRALAIRERSLGPEHPRVADSLVASAENLEALDRREEALAQVRRAEAILTKTLGKDHPDLGHARHTTANLLRALGRHEEALAAYREALAIKENALGKNASSVATSAYGVGEALLDLGRGEEALAMFERALAIDREAYGDDSVELAYDLTGIGRAHLSLGKPEAARAPLERALALRADGRGNPVEVAETKFMLARALWRTDEARALALATSARIAYAEAGPARKKELAAIDAWLAGSR